MNSKKYPLPKRFCVYCTFMLDKYSDEVFKE